MIKIKALLFFVFLNLTVVAVPAWAVIPPDGDPWESFNRKMWAINSRLDKYILKPAAKGYQKVTPQAVDESVSKFFSNIGNIPTMINHLAQGEFHKSGTHLRRFVINTTVGVAGIFDIASNMGVPNYPTDAGVTLAKYGARPGPYLMVPFLGPRTLRSLAGMGPQSIIDPITYVEPLGTQIGIRVIQAVDGRAGLLLLEQAIIGDRYTFLRDYYIKQRIILVTGEAPEDDGFGDDFEYEDEDEEW